MYTYIITDLHYKTANINTHNYYNESNTRVHKKMRRNNTNVMVIVDSIISQDTYTLERQPSNIVYAACQQFKHIINWRYLPPIIITNLTDILQIID